MEKLINLEQAAGLIKDGMTIMVGGFIGCGSPDVLIDELVKNGVTDLTLICNDTVTPDRGVGKMVVNRQFSKIIATHIGTNPETGRQKEEGITEVQLVPQGTLAEQIRQGGAGLGGFLTKVGVGTLVEEGKEKIVVDGTTYLLEKPLRADVTLIRAAKADTAGNLFMAGSTRNFGQIMATASDIVIVEAEKVVPAGEIGPEYVHVPGIFVDYIVPLDQ